MWLHIEDQQHIVFVGGEEANAIEQGRETELTAFFKLNAEEKEKLGNNFSPKKHTLVCGYSRKLHIQQQKIAKKKARIVY